MTPLAISVENLSKTYRTGFWLNQRVQSLHDCHLDVATGETFGLLGPNGAGKTTTIKCLLGIITPTSGRGTLLGKALGDQNIKQQVGYLPENPYFYTYLTAWEFLEFAGRLFQISNTVLKERIPALLELVGLPLEAARKKQLRTYSKGMLQRTGMAQALINDPELVFLDEPMSGLDPIGRYQMRTIIESLKQQGKTVFFNSHILSDVEAICDRVALLVKGTLICQGRLDELLSPCQTYQLRGRNGDREALGRALDTFEVVHTNDEGQHWQASAKGELSDCLNAIVTAGATLDDLSFRRQSLEEFFLEQVRQATPA